VHRWHLQHPVVMRHRGPYPPCYSIPKDLLALLSHWHSLVVEMISDSNPDSSQIPGIETT